MEYVIIGNSAAAVGCVEGIRQIDTEGNITIISDEKYHTYSRPLISYLLYGKTDLEKMKYRPDDFYEKNKCNLILDKSVAKILKDEKKVELSDGNTISYDKLLVATGSRPFVPNIQGLETVEKRFTFMTLDDAKALEKAINKDSKVLIMGAGLIGLKCAEGISKIVKNITVVDLADKILPSILDEDASSIVKAHIEEKGIEFILSDAVNEFKGNTAVLKSGKEVSFDVLVVAVGVRPNTSLISDIGGKVNKGIVTDEKCSTSLENIYSAGDCTESHDITIDQDRILALLPNAYMQGECAGINMAGGEKLYDKAIPMNAIGFFGLHILTAGSYDGTAYITTGEKAYKKLISKDNLLKGFILVGDIARTGIYTSLIRDKTPLDSIDFDLIKDKPQLRAFSQVKRQEILGGVSK